LAYITPHTWTSEQATVALMNEINNNLKALFPVGSYTFLCRAATTAETLIDDCWLECNGVSVLRATYPDLNTLLSGLGYPFGTVDGTHMTLPDAQGRVVVSQASGGHTDVNALGDSDGLAKASRTPEGSVSVSTSVSGSVSSGSIDISGLTISGAPGGTLSGFAAGGQGPGYVSLTAGTLDVGGTATLSSGTVSGSGSGSGTVPGNYIAAGVLFIKAFT
jgi:microcystin-dependent protein